MSELGDEQASLLPDKALSLISKTGLASAREWAIEAVVPCVQGRAPGWREVFPREKARIQVACEDLLAPQWTTPGPWSIHLELQFPTLPSVSS